MNHSPLPVAPSMFRRLLSLRLLALSLLFSSLGYADDGAAAQFQAQCTACHTIGQGKRVGPDLVDVSKRRPHEWLVRWITNPEMMLAEKDPTAVELLNTYQVPMPNQQVTTEQAEALIAYIDRQSAAPVGETDAGVIAAPAPTPPTPIKQQLGETQQTALLVFLGFAFVIAAVFAWVSLSAGGQGSVNTQAGYRSRTVLFWVAVPTIVGLLVFTLRKTPYSTEGTPDRVVYVATRQFEFIFSNEPITKADEVARVPHIQPSDLPLNGLIEFRVTSLDVTHNFAIYDEQGAIKTQVQSMPGYVNRLRTRFERPGSYNVLCLEYCGLAHHAMRATITAK